MPFLYPFFGNKGQRKRCTLTTEKEEKKKEKTKSKARESERREKRVICIGKDTVKSSKFWEERNSKN